MKTTTKSGLNVKAAVKAGALPFSNHNRGGLKVRANVRAGAYIVNATNHSRSLSSR
jgi:hypothetical protein